MEQHRFFTDNEFEYQFETCQFPATLFSHEAHLRLAWIYIQKYGIHDAISHTCQQLAHYVAALGATDKYNITLTVASVKAVYHFMLKSKSDTFSDFITEFPRLKFHLKELLACHYSPDIYSSPMAKTQYLEPDLCPFDV